MECPKCEREIKEEEKVCPYCKYDLVNNAKTESEIHTKLINFIHKKSLLIESILGIIVIIMLATIVGTNAKKESLENQYNEVQATLEDTSIKLNSQIKEKDDKIVELQQEEKKNEINQSIQTLENEKQKLEEEKKSLETEKETLTSEIEELKKTSSILTEKKNAKVSTSSTPTTTTVQNTNSAIVYVTNTGKKYHKSSCSYLKKSKIEMSLSEAQSKGYTACSKCY